MKIAIYARVSTGRQETDNQLLQMREFAAKQNWTIIREFVDEVTGSTSERDEFKAMLRAAEQKKFDLLLFWSLDRFSRQGALPTLQYLGQLTDYGVKWRSFTEPYLDSAGVFGDAIVALLATLARQERIRLIERTRAGLDRARRRGKKLGRPAVKLDSARIRVMRDAGASWSQVARELNAARDTCKRAQANFDGKQA